MAAHRALESREKKTRLPERLRWMVKRRLDLLVMSRA